MVMFAIFAGVLVLLLLGVTTAVTMGFASIATFLMAGADMTRLFLVLPSLGHHLNVYSVFLAHGQPHERGRYLQKPFRFRSCLLGS